MKVQIGETSMLRLTATRIRPEEVSSAVEVSERPAREGYVGIDDTD